MKKINSNGFSAIEGLLILVIVGMLGFVGWYVWDKNKSINATPVTNSTPVNTSKTYSDDYISLTYPEGWIVKRDDNKSLKGTKKLTISSPLTTFPLEGPDHTSLRFRLDIFQNSKDSNLSGCDDCAVLDEVVKLDNPNLPGTKLIFTESNYVASSHDNKSDTIAVVTADVKVGDKGYDGLIKLGGKTLLISSDFETEDGSTTSDNFKSVSALKATNTFAELVSIINSVTIK